MTKQEIIEVLKKMFYVKSRRSVRLIVKIVNIILHALKSQKFIKKY